MNRSRWLAVVVLVCLALGHRIVVGTDGRAAETKQQLTKKLWPKQRIVSALHRIEKMKEAGLMSPSHYRRKKAMLEARLNGTFQPTMLSTTNPPLNFIQNGGFEDINRNSRPDRSRWLWWNGWSWGGDYENHWEDRPQYVRSGKYSARIRCLGRRGRIGIMTPKLPVVPGANRYEFSIWAKGEGDNQLFINFESGARGTYRGRIGPDWQQVRVIGTLEPKATGYAVYVYVTGEGTIWLDDAKLVPLGIDDPDNIGRR
ncbi:MAG: hypothetical protein GXP27_09725 [Planctomycetes bacterium]|nr:hypothetical protein [Planctomycetota bacterium]